MRREYVKTPYGYTKKESVERLSEVDAIIFDCDGVLIDVSQSYLRAPIETCSRIMELLGSPVEPKPPKEAVQAFKETGGFNNDWDVAYAMTTYAILTSPEGFRRRLVALVEERPEEDPLEGFLWVSRRMREAGSKPLRLDVEGLRRFASLFDDEGIAKMERVVERMHFPKDTYRAVSKLLAYPGDVGSSVVTTVFEELFCGSELFRSVYGLEPRFHSGGGLIDLERPMVSEELLTELLEVLGDGRLGIASGRARALANHTLGDLMRFFVEEATTFLEDLRGDLSLMKPNPYTLLRSASGLEPFKAVLYVGDSAEDVIASKRAGEVDGRFLSACLYGNAPNPGRALRRFMELGADLIMRSVDELPEALRHLRETA